MADIPEIYKEKARFVKKLQTFYQRECRNIETIKRLDYKYFPETGAEFIYVTYTQYGSQRRFSVMGDNEQGMMKDFCYYLDHAENFYWLLRGDIIEEFMEEE